jgi:hypothetical protein
MAQRQLLLFDGTSGCGVPTPKYRRQSFHSSDVCGAQHIIPWNKSFDEGSCVYRAAVTLEIQSGRETLPNRCDDIGIIEAIRAPYQRDSIRSANPDVLFLWRK